MKFVLIKVFFAFLLVIFSVKCDLPVHCLKSQVTGEWTIHTTTLKKLALNERYYHKCGHTLPSHENNAYKSLGDKSKYNQTMKVSLKKNDQATIIESKLSKKSDKKVGSWTMVYDEGFDITIGKKKFFTFNMYTPKEKPVDKSNKFNSHCYATLSGWYSDGDKYGCFYATKDGEKDPYKITNDEASDKQHVVEGVVEKSGHKYRFKEMDKIEKELETDDYSSGLTDLNNGLTDLGVMNFIQTTNKIKNNSHLKLSSSFKEHAKVVERINSLNLSWKAENYNQFADMTIQELNKFTGRKSSNREVTKTKNKEIPFKDFRMKQVVNSIPVLHNKKLKKRKKEAGFDLMRFKEKEVGSIFDTLNFARKAKRRRLRDAEKTKEESIDENAKDPEFTDLPKNFIKWKSFCSKAESQGACGSCFALSTKGMLEARLRIHHKKDVKLSLKHMLKCSVQNQGCDGGYSYLVSRFGSDIELVPESCVDNEHTEIKCAKKCKDEAQQNELIKVKDYKFVGGSYGKSSEETMMREIYKNGPIVCSFSPDYTFSMYKEGIYDSIGTKNWKGLGLSKPEWVKVDHSVLCIGWGYDEALKKKYWLVRNSWGGDWGDHGDFKIIRGRDFNGIESIGESSMPYIATNSN